MSKFDVSKKQNESVAAQVTNFTRESAAILTAAAPALLLIVILVAAVAASYIEYLFHKEVVGEFAMVSGGCYGMFRFSVGGAGVQMAKVNRWIPCALFIAISLAFTIWSTFHVETAADILRIGGTTEAAKVILLSVLWMAFAGELVLGVFSFSMDMFKKKEDEAEAVEAEAGLKSGKKP